ncbi:LytTR family DNA-binding domain-containing protein [Clostridium sp. CMCC3677]|uniref:LytR/AlgR family response regulator transcription factor n=1 Tax=Clostridium sp. CMCC3677 TaxID=2949963 RepID=UPI0013F00159|nr:LytTR family DNA-binding domain-containing protein [Clostridium sp. CMCC3677]NFG63086.1 response regulator transcription factor [Clostridium botulinum]NFQ08016.1 response regulator transcription factor [Clostridium botulinum]
MKNILIIEDDIYQRKNLKDILSEVDKNLNVYEAEDEVHALDICNKVSIDLFYVDVSLQDSSGMDFCLKLRKIQKYEFSWIVFITTHIQYMIEAFKEIHCYDYLLKPYEKKDLIKLTKKLICTTQIDDLSEKERKHIVLKISNCISAKIFLDEIVFIEVRLRTCTVHSKKGKYEIKGLTLNRILSLINCDDILQCHKSFIVNINYIDRIERLSSTLYEIYFNNYKEKAFLGYKFKNVIMNKFK